MDAAQQLLSDAVAAKLVSALQAMGYDVCVGQERVLLPNAEAISLAGILREVADRFGMRPEHLTSPNRMGRLVRPRHMAYWLARECTDASLPVIARAYKRDHTTIIHGIDRYRRFWAPADPEFAAIGNEFKARWAA